MKLNILYRIFKQCDLRVLSKLTINLGLRGLISLNRFKKRLKKNKPFFPAFLAVSITDKCNLSCRGCWVSQSESSKQLSYEQLDNIVKTAKKYGSYFFAILGGEPLLHPQIFEIMEKHSDCYFQLFTNGTMLTEKTALKLRSLANVSPLISIEGLEKETGHRRGDEKVFQKSVDAVINCVNQKLFTGVATSICKTNFDELVSEKFLNFLIKKGVHYVWYYIYRPVGKDPAPDLAITEE